MKFAKKTGKATFKLSPSEVAKIRKALACGYRAFLEFSELPRAQHQLRAIDWLRLIRMFDDELPQRKDP